MFTAQKHLLDPRRSNLGIIFLNRIKSKLISLSQVNSVIRILILWLQFGEDNKDPVYNNKKKEEDLIWIEVEGLIVRLERARVSDWLE